MPTILNRLKEIASAVVYATEAQNIEEVLERIAHVARELSGTRYAALGVPDGKGSLRYFITSGISADAIEKMPHHPKGLGLIGAIMRERHSIRLEHMRDDPRSVGFPEHHPHMESFLGVPVMAGNQLYGMLYLSDKENGEMFTDEDQVLIETLAGYAALAIASADVRERESRLRLLEERERIGMELHDGIIQSLYGIGMQTSLLRHKAEINSDDIQTVVDNLNGVIEDIRGFIGNLRKHDAPKMSMYECLVRLKERLNPPQTIQIAITAPEFYPPFSPAKLESVCLIVNEALSNAIRHAEATEIQLSAKHEHNRLFLQVADNGKGFEVDAGHASGGLGLRNMRHRARLYGGDIHIASEVGTGTQVFIQIPLGAY